MNIPANPKRFGSVFVGLYGWLLAIFSGMIFIDIVYSKSILETANVASTVSDLLLGIGFFVLISALFALIFSKKKSVRILVFASTCLILSEFLLPAFLAPFIQNPSEFAIGPWLRIVPGALASILAMIGVNQAGRN